MAGLPGCQVRAGYLRVHPEDLLSSSIVQMMSLAELGAKMTDLLEQAAARRIARQAVPLGERQAVARRHGCEPGTVVSVLCPCGAQGEIRWSKSWPKFIGMDLDHIFPLARGGRHEAANLQLLCPRCNRAKGSRVGGV